jgi:hypothetical protein
MSGLHHFRWALAPVLVLAWVAGAGATPPPSGDERADIFHLQRARREQQRDATPAAPYRANVPWPVGAAAAGEEAPRWLRISAGPEWDGQPTLLSNGIGLPQEIASSSEGAGVWFLDTGAQLFERGRWSGGLAGSYWGAAYSDLDFDTHYPSLVSFLDRTFGDDKALRLRYDVGYSWVDMDGFATTHHVGPRFYKSWQEHGDSEFRAEYYNYAFHLDLASQGSQRRDRSGWGFIIAAEHRVALDFNDSDLRFGYHYQHYIPEGAEFHNQSHQLWIGGATALPLAFVLDANVSFLYQGARNDTSFPGPDQPTFPGYDRQGFRRHDRIWRTEVALGRSFGSHVSGSFEWGFVNHDSNISLYDFRAHRVGTYLTVHFN